MKSLGEGKKVKESARKTKFGSNLRDCGATDDYLYASAQSFYQQTQKRTNPHILSQKRGKNGKEQVIQGSHMVSGTRCPAWSDLLKKWNESRTQDTGVNFHMS